MQRLFTQESPNRNQQVFAGLFQAQRGLDKALERVKAKAVSAPRRLKDTHPIIKLLDSLPPMNAMNMMRYYDYLEDVEMDIAHGQHINTEINTYPPLEGEFYGGDIADILVATTLTRPTWSSEGLLADWSSTSALRVLYHPSSDLNLNLPDGQRQHHESGYSIIAVDIPLLAVQYRTWATLENRKPLEERESTGMFVYQHVLGNMLDHQLTLSLMNRYMRTYNGEEQTKSIIKPILALPDFSNGVDKEYQEVIDTLLRMNASIDDVLDNAPLRLGETLRTSLPFNRLVSTRQISWLLWLVWLPWIKHALSWYLTTNQGQDRDFENMLKRELRRARSDRSSQTAPYGLLRDLLEIELEGLKLLL